MLSKNSERCEHLVSCPDVAVLVKKEGNQPVPKGVQFSFSDYPEQLMKDRPLQKESVKNFEIPLVPFKEPPGRVYGTPRNGFIRVSKKRFHHRERPFFVQTVYYHEGNFLILDGALGHKGLDKPCCAVNIQGSKCLQCFSSHIGKANPGEVKDLRHQTMQTKSG